MFNQCFVLLPAIKDIIFQKDCHKKYAFLALTTSSFKIIFILLIKVVTFHIQLAVINFRVLRFEKPIQGIFLKLW